MAACHGMPLFGCPNGHKVSLMDAMTETQASRRVELAQRRLQSARAGLAAATSERDAIEARASSRHWTESDPAIGSGIRRKPNAKADARRFDGYAREASVYVRVDQLTKDVALLENVLALAEAERDRRVLTHEDVVGAVAVRDSYGWHRVAKVNRTTVSVETGYSWTDRIEFARILEVCS